MLLKQTYEYPEVNVESFTVLTDIVMTIELTKRRIPSAGSEAATRMFRAPCLSKIMLDTYGG